MKQRKIYLAGSWRNDFNIFMIEGKLTQLGHQVDCFCKPQRDRFVFNYLDIEGFETLDAISFLKDDRSRRAFTEDKKWLDWCDTCILILPSGKSAHLEAGYAKGKGKDLFILGDFPIGEFDVMYGFADGLFRFSEFESLVKKLNK